MASETVFDAAKRAAAEAIAESNIDQAISLLHGAAANLRSSRGDFKSLYVAAIACILEDSVSYREICTLANKKGTPMNDIEKGDYAAGGGRPDTIMGRDPYAGTAPPYTIPYGIIDKDTEWPSPTKAQMGLLGKIVWFRRLTAGHVGELCPAIIEKVYSANEVDLQTFYHDLGSEEPPSWYAHVWHGKAPGCWMYSEEGTK